MRRPATVSAMSSPIRLSEHPVKRSAHAVVTTSGGRRLLGVTIYSAQRSLLELCGGIEPQVGLMLLSLYTV